MKIAAIYTESVGPLADGEISFKNEWTGEVESNILLTGPNGCGKSTLLRAVAMLWEALGYWLDQRKPVGQPLRNELKRWGGIAIVLEDVYPIITQKIGLYFGKEGWVDALTKNYSEILWMGDTYGITIKNSPIKKIKFNFHNESWFEAWAEAHKRLILTQDAVKAPNVIYMDAEERRWVTPKRKVSEPLPDVLSQRWLTRYKVSEDWQGQLESSLINLKTSQLRKFHNVIKALNEYLVGKVIDTNIKPGEGRLRIKLHNQRGKFHYMDELSAGEHQVLIMLYMLQRWMQPGGVVLIDEPDLHLHPSLITPLLAAIENIVKEQDGQLIITSHATDIWQRYENLGMRVDLTRVKDVTDGQH